MNYQFKGSLSGFICKDASEFLSNVKVRLYRVNIDNNLGELVVANPKDTFRLLDGKQIDAKETLLIAETETEEKGNFTFNLSEKQNYDGEAFQIDVYLESVPYQKEKKGKFKSQQFTITTLQPQWRKCEQGLCWSWKYCIPYRFWCAIRSLFDAWVIYGKVTLCKDNTPLSGLTVKAFDKDWITDDNLGSALTDVNGNFRIDYTSADFKVTFLSPLINVETPFPPFNTGPDVYFHIFAGALPLKIENSSRGDDPDRENVGNCFCVCLCVEKVPVNLECNLDEPSGCKHGDKTIDPPKTLEPIVGTASGLGFKRYELELYWNGTDNILGAIIYADNVGNPDNTLTFGDHQVIADNLGFVDLEKAILGAGSNILISTHFEVRLHVHGIDGSVITCSSNFSITAAKAYIKRVGGGWVPDVTNPLEELRRSDSSSGEKCSVGGNISVRGAADAYGCGNQKISTYSLWYKLDPTFTEAQPPNGSAFDPSLPVNGWSNITTVTFTNDDQRNHNKLDGTPNPSWLTNKSTWGTRTICSYIDFLPPICFSVPDLKEYYWNSAPTGKYSLLLKVEDTGGNTYYDIQRVFIDNETIKAEIKELRYTGTVATIPPCTDILINDGAGNARSLDIRGYATDALIDATDLTLPSDNFDKYKVLIQKQGAPGNITVKSDTSTPVPNRATWSGDPIEPSTDLLTTLDLSWFDATTPAPLDDAGIPVPGSHRLPRGTACTYVIKLYCDDKTIVNEATDHHIPGWYFSFPVKIINDLT